MNPKLEIKMNKSEYNNLIKKSVPKISTSRLS